MTPRPSHDTPREYPESTDLAGKWRRLAKYAYAAIDQALDSSPREAMAILAEAAGELEGAIDLLDAVAMAAEGRAT